LITFKWSVIFKAAGEEMGITPTGNNVNDGQFHHPSKSSFYARRSQKRKKKTVKLSVFFALMGSARTKASHGTLIKLAVVSGSKKFLIKLS